MKTQKFKVPGYLRAETRKWVEEVLASYELESHHYKILLAAASSWDRIQMAQETLKEQGLFTKDRYGTAKAHPAAKIECDNKTLFARLIRELGLDLEPRSSESFRPPRQY